MIVDWCFFCVLIFMQVLVEASPRKIYIVLCRLFEKYTARGLFDLTSPFSILRITKFHSPLLTGS
jgi:hypothetical protein